MAMHFCLPVETEPDEAHGCPEQMPEVTEKQARGSEDNDGDVQ